MTLTASILSSLYNELVMTPSHHANQDTNDKWVLSSVLRGRWLSHCIGTWQTYNEMVSDVMHRFVLLLRLFTRNLFRCPTCRRRRGKLGHPYRPPSTAHPSAQITPDKLIVLGQVAKKCE